MSNSSISLCIPAYNAADYLPRLLKSALAQTILFNEVLVYDDCSTDNTADIARQYGATVIQGDVNRGCSFGKNVLAEHTTCEWIHFHDADDVLYPNFVETAQKWMLLNNSPDIVLFDYEWRNNETNELINIRKFNDNELRKDAIAYTIREQINPFCGLYRRSAYLKAGGYDTDPLVLYNEDVAFHCRMAIAGLKFAADPTIAIINYYRPNSMSAANQVKCARAHFYVMKKVATVLNGSYTEDITKNLWGCAGVSASYLDWKNVDNCLSLATTLNKRVPQNINSTFRLICKFNPYFAIRFREWSIRILKPQLRRKVLAN